jgi:hypothetical protein
MQYVKEDNCKSLEAFLKLTTLSVKDFNKTAIRFLTGVNEFHHLQIVYT